MSIFSTLATGGGALGYKPTALFSFEFIPRQNRSKGVEMFLLVPPEQYSMQYGYRMTVHKTIGSTVVDWSGVDNPVIQLSGSLWSYWIDQLPAPFGNRLLGDGVAGQVLNNFVSGFVNKAATALGSAISNFFPLNTMSGLDEFFRLKFMLYDFWQKEGLALDPALTSDQLVPTSLNQLGQLPVDGIFGGMRKLAKLHEQNNLYDIQLVYHDYDDNIHWEVVPQSFTPRRDKSDPFTVFWNASFVGIRDLRKKPYFVPVVSKKTNADQVMKDIAAAMVAVNPLNVVIASGKTIEAEYKELSKLSWDGVMANYEIALSDFFNGFRDNQEEVISLSDSYAKTARAAAYEAIQIFYQNTQAQYKTNSNTNTPTTDIIESGRSDAILAIGEFLMMSTMMAGIKAYRGLRNAVLEGNSNSTLFDLADIEESYFRGGVNPGTVNYSENTWRTYTVKVGDNLASIAIRELNDYSRFPEIAKLNNLTLTDFNLNAMVGKTIKLPIETQSVQNKPGNLVFWRNIPKRQTDQTLQEEIIGRDLFLDSNRGISVDNSGDLRIAAPLDGFKQNVADSVTIPQGSLPLYPEWGAPVSVGTVGDQNSEIVIQNKIESAIYVDPRVRAVIVDRKKTKQVGDALYFESTVEPLVGRPVVI